MFTGEILLNPFAIALVLAPFLSLTAIMTVAGAALLRILLEYIVFFVLNNRERMQRTMLVMLPAAVVFKDILMLYVYLQPFFSRTLLWRGTTIKIGKYTLLPFGWENHLLDGA